MSLFESHTELTLLDLSYGGQLPACERWVGRAPAGTTEAARPTPRDVIGLDDLTGRVTEMDVADLLMKFGGGR